MMLWICMALNTLKSEQHFEQLFASVGLWILSSHILAHCSIEVPCLFLWVCRTLSPYTLPQWTGTDPAGIHSQHLEKLCTITTGFCARSRGRAENRTHEILVSSSKQNCQYIRERMMFTWGVAHSLPMKAIFLCGKYCIDPTWCIRKSKWDSCQENPGDATELGWPGFAFWSLHLFR